MDFDAAYLKQRGLITTGFHLPYNPKLVDRAKEMRKHPTLAEKKIWRLYLRKLKYRVLRQRVIDHFIVDFYCPKLKLVIEIDGGIHDLREQKEYDEQRALFLEVYELVIIRFKNKDVLEKFDYVVKKVDCRLEKYV